MTDPAGPRPKVDAESEDSVQVSSRALRRRSEIRRRLTMLVAGLLAILALSVWARTQSRARECRRSLEHYARLAKKADLKALPVETLELEWRNLKSAARVSQTPDHYELLSQWYVPSSTGSSALLAICNCPHGAGPWKFRNVLYGDHRVEQVTEEEALKLIQTAGLLRP